MVELEEESTNSVFYALDDFFVELCFTMDLEPRVAVISFTRRNHRYEVMVNALPVDPDDPMRTAA